ncbi:MAG: anhydro-N-acetylmuramic acid kinase [Pseudomonadota bacterium]
MPDNQIYTVIGMMSGSSHDGVDAALIKTDGYDYVEPVKSVTTPYVRGLREKICSVLNPDPKTNLDIENRIRDVEETLTRAHIATLYELLNKAGVTEDKIDFVGIHGHTIHHDPKHGVTRQIGDARLLADETSIPVIADFRTADVKAGGQGAPLAPIYHRARAEGLEKPLAVLNLGGVGNITYLGEAGEIIAFDTGPANALIDDWVYAKTGQNFDTDGELAKQGKVDTALVKKWMQNPYFTRSDRKSLDRNDFEYIKDDMQDLSLEDGAATLTAFTIETIQAALGIVPQPPKRWLITGGGRKNSFLMYTLMRRLEVPVEPVEAVGWNGDALEAQCFGYLAVRRFLGLPISFPSTTGAPQPMTGGVMFEPKAGRKRAI